METADHRTTRVQEVLDLLEQARDTAQQAGQADIAEAIDTAFRRCLLLHVEALEMALKARMDGD